MIVTVWGIVAQNHSWVFVHRVLSMIVIVMFVMGSDWFVDGCETKCVSCVHPTTSTHGQTNCVLCCLSPSLLCESTQNSRSDVPESSLPCLCVLSVRSVSCSGLTATTTANRIANYCSKAFQGLQCDCKVLHSLSPLYVIRFYPIHSEKASFLVSFIQCRNHQTYVCAGGAPPAFAFA